MISDNQTKEEFDKIVFESMKRELEQIKKENIVLQEKVRKSIQIGSIYGLKHRVFETIDYVGFHIGKNINSRKATHLLDLVNTVKNIPFYKYFVHEMFVLYEMVLLEQFEFTDRKDLLKKEKHYQQLYKSIQTSDNYQCQKCKKLYKQVNRFTTHRYKCYAKQRVQIPAINELFSESDSE